MSNFKMSDKSDVEKEIRKCRKKLRQIDRLLHLDRELADDELTKVIRKDAIREKLLSLLEERGEDYNTTLGSTVTSSYVSDVSHRSADVSDVSLTCVDDGEDVCHTNEDNQTRHEAPFHSTPVAEAALAPQMTSTAPQVQLYDDVKSKGEPVTMDTQKEARQGKSSQKGSSQEKVKEQEKKPKDSKPKQHSKAKKEQTHTDSKKTSLMKDWLKRAFKSTELEGHNDVVTAIDINDTHILTGSRDTMVKLWNNKTGRELHSFGAHSATVSAVKLLCRKLSKAICEGENLEVENPLPADEMLAISGSHDCCLKIWALKTGQLVRSLYTFNAITTVDVLEEHALIVTTSDGGKVQLWDAGTGSPVYEVVGHQDSITSLQVVNNFLYTACMDGLIQCYEYVPTGRHLRRLFRSEQLRHRDGGDVIERATHALACYDDVIYFGDDGMNIKALHWKKGEVHKLPNHKTDFGATHCLMTQDVVNETTFDVTLFSSGHDLDSGQGYINVWLLPEESYMCTLFSDHLTRVVSMACSSNKSGLQLVVSCGKQLYLWSQVKDTRDDGEDWLIRPQYFPEFSGFARDSEPESSDEEEDEAQTGSGRSRDYYSRRQNGNGANGTNSGGWFSYCNML